MSRTRTTKAITALTISVMLLGATLAVSSMLGIQTAQAQLIQLGSGLNGIDAKAIQGSGEDKSSDGNSGGGRQNSEVGTGNDNNNFNDRHNKDGNEKAIQGSGEENGRISNSRQDSNRDNEQGQEYCYSVSITNPLNGKTRTVDVCFGSRSECEHSQQHDPDSASDCDRH